MEDTSFLKRLLSGKFLIDLWQKEGESILGIDLGSSSLKVVQIRKTKERAVLETYGELSVAHYAGTDIGMAAILPEDKAVEMIRDAVKESNAKATDAVASISLRNSFVTVIDMPVMSDKDLAKSIAYEARRYIPVPISEVEMDWWVLPHGIEAEGEEAEVAKKKTTVPVLLVAIHKNVLDQQKNMIRRANLELKTFEVEIFSLARACLGRELVPVLIIDLGASATKMTIVDYGIVRMAHSFGSGAQDITATLSRALRIDFGRAEKLKREVGLSDRPEHKEMKQVMSPMLDYVFAEAARLSSDYRMRHGRSISRVILAGGGALLPGITEYAVNKFGVEVSMANPFTKVEYPAFLEPALREVGPNFASAIGLALRGLK